ncbi:Granzyme-like protein 1 [Orchesella cincta]|uniref:Granzyme-like protein 1 n=1 Tax=Orchesella cincta TaxID=48709 RepID=A0A1D2MK66_ORCCI|nr:Granzyme-like protein 1 [Orchesella cincta]
MFFFCHQLNEVVVLRNDFALNLSNLDSEMMQKNLLAAIICIACFFPAEAILGGENAIKNEFPWQVLLEMKDSIGDTEYCSGSLIALDLVLTSAGCVVTKSSNITVIAGSLYLSKDEETKQYRSSENVIMHELYNTSGKHNDIALIRLQQKFTESAAIKTINLPPRDYDPELSKYGTIAGWGLLNITTEEMPEQLQKSNLSIIGAGYCKATGASLPPGQFCTTGQKGGYKGDEGGPLICDQFPKAVCGIFSHAIFDPKNTGNRNADVVGGYLEVSRYVDWIEDHMTTNPTTPRSQTTTTQNVTNFPTANPIESTPGGTTVKSPLSDTSLAVLYVTFSVVGVVLASIVAVLLYQKCYHKRHTRLRESIVSLPNEYHGKPFTISNGYEKAGEEHDA